jgi:hypothetical protein
MGDLKNPPIGNSNRTYIGIRTVFLNYWFTLPSPEQKSK